MARRVRSLRPTLRTTTGLLRSAARSSAATNRSGCRTVSRNIAITRVAGSSTRYSRKSTAATTASLPDEITWLQPKRRQRGGGRGRRLRSEEHTSELQSRQYLVCRLLLEKKKDQ